MTNLHSNSVSVIDLATLNGSHSVSVIDTISNIVKETIGSIVYLIDVAITPDGSRALVVNHSSNSISVIDTSDNSVSMPVVAGLGRTSFGSIDDVGERILTVSDLLDSTHPNAEGVLVSADESGGTTPAKVQPCGLEFMGNAGYMNFRVGDEQEIYCGSLLNDNPPLAIKSVINLSPSLIRSAL